MKVLVGMSGGVDSSVAALLLKEAGHEVIGAIMSIYGGEGSHSCSGKNACYGPDEKEDIEEAKKISAELGIPLYVIDCIDEYKQIVLDDFKSEYLAGRTPNPCIWCNSQIKFKTLPKLVEKKGIAFDKFATGHYARVEFDDIAKKYYLKRAVDERKDQTYFLYRLTQDKLENIMFPLGDLTKEQVREIARKSGLSVSEKEESQDFYSGDYNELICAGDVKGNIVNKNNEILGQHNGIWNYTIGQRKGLGIAYSEPLYVIGFNSEKNEVIVGIENETYGDILVATNLNLLAPEKIDLSKRLTAKIRSAQALQGVYIKSFTQDSIEVQFEEKQKAITPGQSIVLYADDILIGGGIIEKTNKIN